MNVSNRLAVTMARLLMIYLCACFPITLSAQVTDVTFGNYHALIISNEVYEDPNWDRLPGTSKDADAVANVLEEMYGFQVTRLRDASKQEILDELWDYRDKLTQEDNLLIYYAGHGEVLDGSGYWVGKDGTRNNPSRWLSGYDLGAPANAISAKHIIIIADSCYAGTVFRSGDKGTQRNADEDDIAWWKRMSTRRARQWLTSGNVERVIDSGGPKGLSVFAGHFVTELEANDAVIEASAIFENIKKPVLGAARDLLGETEPAQQPDLGDVHFANHAGGDFLFVRKGFEPAPREIKLNGQPSGAAVTKFAIRGSMEVVSSLGTQRGPEVNQNPIAERLEELLQSRFVVSDHLVLRLDGGRHTVIETPNISASKIKEHKAAVVHFTAGGTLRSLSQFLSTGQVAASYHIIIDRDGSTVQMVPFDRPAWHAGRSQLLMKDGTVLQGLNRHTIGIGLVNDGQLKKQGNAFTTVYGRSFEESERVFTAPDGTHWEHYSPEQISVLVDILERITAAYDLEAIVGHSEISQFKADPGPAFPMDSIRSEVFQ